MTQQEMAVPVGGVMMPLLGFGTWQLSGRSGYKAVRAALDTGYRHLDTATGYNNEAEVGRAVRDSGIPRDQIFITTKLPPERGGRERATLTASLRALQVDAVDLWLIHWPPTRSDAVSVWRQFQQLRDEGLTRAIGVSNFSIDQIDALVKETGEYPAVNQIPWSPWDYSASLLAAHTERGIVLEGYSPLKRSDLSAPVLTEIATRHGVTQAQVVLRWHLDHGVVVIPKSADPERIRHNHDIFGFSLSAEEIARIDALGA